MVINQAPDIPCKHSVQKVWLTGILTKKVQPQSQMKITAILLLTLSLIFCCHKASAYKPQSGHQPITELALEGFKSCYPNLPLTDQAAANLLKGNLAMDYGMGAFTTRQKHLTHAVKVFSPLSRTKNWHFYNPNKTSNTRQQGVEMSNERLWQRALEGISLYDGHDDKWLFVGALIHLTEDLSSPAHSVPVYHGPTKALDWLGDFSSLVNYPTATGAIGGLWFFEMLYDGFDSFEVAQQRLSADIKANPQSYCLNNPLMPNQIRSAQAKETLAIINKAIPGCSLPWKVFWSEQNPGNLASQGYFKRYNSQLNFGQTGHLKDKMSQPECEVGTNQYKELAYQLHRSAVRHDIALMHWAYNRIKD